MIRFVFVLLICGPVMAEVAVFDLEKSHVDKEAVHLEGKIAENAVHGESRMVNLEMPVTTTTNAPLATFRCYIPFKPTQPLVSVVPPEGMVKGTATANFAPDSWFHVHDVSFHLLDKDSAQIIADAIVKVSTELTKNVGTPIHDAGEELKHWLVAVTVLLVVALVSWYVHVQKLKAGV